MFNLKVNWKYIDTILIDFAWCVGVKIYAILKLTVKTEKNELIFVGINNFYLIYIYIYILCNTNENINDSVEIIDFLGGFLYIQTSILISSNPT